MSFAAMWVDPENIILSEEREKQISYDINYQFSSVQFSCSVVSDSLRPHARPPCPPPAPAVYPNSCPSSWWCHPVISSSVVPFSSCPSPSQHQGLFQWVNSLHEVAKVLEFQVQHLTCNLKTWYKKNLFTKQKQTNRFQSQTTGYQMGNLVTRERLYYIKVSIYILLYILIQ